VSSSRDQATEIGCCTPRLRRHRRLPPANCWRS
jgi:hypothetical protein